jgi:hypothetical protein
MGVLVPHDLKISSIPDHTERRVIENFRDRLSDSWFIIPRLDVVTRRRPHEVDVLLFHEANGIIGVEVKGGPFRIESGIWKREEETFDVSPPRQSQNACYALRDRLRDHDHMFEHLEIMSAVALPDCGRFFFDLPEVLPEQIFFQDDLADPAEALFRLISAKSYHLPLSSQQIEEFVRFVRPNLTFEWDPQAQAADARRSLNRIMRVQIDALATLDMNQRVFVQGAAGTGKTQLAVEWAHRAALRRETTLLTCFNIPLGHRLRMVAEANPAITAGEFLTVVLQLEGLPPIPEPPERNEQWYRTAVPMHVHAHLDKVHVRFDTIIVDEVQDFHREWIDLMLALLKPEGRLSVTGDELQGLYRRTGIERVLELNPARAELRENCRNTHQIGSALQRLGGARAAAASPDGQGIYFYSAESDDAILNVLEVELEDLIGTRGIDPENVLIVTTSSRLRTLINDANPGHYECTPWEERGDSNIVCETVHRSKGLEYDAVVFVIDNPHVPDMHLYVGASRAVSLLTVIGPAAIQERLGLL